MCSEVASVTPETNLADALDIMFKARYHDALVQKDGVFQGVVVWHEIVKVKPEHRSATKIGQMPLKKASIFPDESVLEAKKIMTREKIDLLPVVDRDTPTKVICAVTNEELANAIEVAKSRR
jgi:CBS domain-containing protein